MRLSEAERAMADGAQGEAVARAMDLLLRYGRALGAERLVECGNVAGTWSVSNPILRDHAARGFDAAFSEFNLDSDQVVAVPRAATHACQLITGFDLAQADKLGVDPKLAALQEEAERFFGGRGISQHATCTPYQVGVVPVRGEHCAWMESSAVVYCNSVLGARTNTEGRESTGAASLTRRIPYWGLHLPENRGATDLVEVAGPVAGMMEWGLLGYWLGEAVEDEIPVLSGIGVTPAMEELKHFGAAAASSGGVEMFHIPGVTPEAPDLDTALRGRAPLRRHRYGAAERASAWAALNGANTERAVDLVMLGCPHASAAQVSRIAALLEGQRVAPGCALWVFTPRALAAVAERGGEAAAIRRAGGELFSDSCPAISRIMPKGTRVVATDSAKQAHYLPAITGAACWFGDLEDCVRAAVSGRFEGGLAPWA
jgi:predicted aconitase